MKDTAERFISIGEKRVAKAVKAIDLIGNLGNTNNYSYTDEQVTLIFNELESAVANAKKKFVGPKRSKSASDRFRLG